jgi:CHAD domain-containing protein
MGTADHAEAERDYDVTSDLEIPDLRQLAGVERVVVPLHEDQVDSVYFDTGDLALARSGITLRRRAGGPGAGWHLEIPFSREHGAEFHLPLSETHVNDQAVPGQLVVHVRALVRDRPLAPVALVRTTRRAHRLQDVEGATLAEFFDNQVIATLPSGASAQRWREWAIELVSGDIALLDAADTALLGAGASRATSASSVRRALGSRLSGRRGSSKRRDSDVTWQLLAAYLERHVRRLQREDLRLRSGNPAGVHHMRIAARRLRSALASYSQVVQPGATDELRAELKWLGRELAEARDAQVLGDRLATLVERQPQELVLGPVAQRISDDLHGRFQRGHAEALEVLDSDRYFRLLDQLEEFSLAPPISAVGTQSARRMLPKLLAADLKRVRKRAKQVTTASSPRERDLALHEVRKAAKRLRYAAESARPVYGGRAKRLARAAKSVQQLLGEHQDTVVARAVLRELAVGADLEGHNAFTYGLLHAVESARAHTLEDRYAKALTALPQGKLSTWLVR